MEMIMHTSEWMHRVPVGCPRGKVWRAVILCTFWQHNYLLWWVGRTVLGGFWPFLSKDFLCLSTGSCSVHTEA